MRSRNGCRISISSRSWPFSAAGTDISTIGAVVAEYVRLPEASVDSVTTTAVLQARCWTGEVAKDASSALVLNGSASAASWNWTGAGGGLKGTKVDIRWSTDTGGGSSRCWTSA